MCSVATESFVIIIIRKINDVHFSLMVFHYLTESDSSLAEINASIGKISPSDAAKN